MCCKTYKDGRSSARVERFLSMLIVVGSSNISFLVVAFSITADLKHQRHVYCFSSTFFLCSTGTTVLLHFMLVGRTETVFSISKVYVEITEIARRNYCKSIGEEGGSRFCIF